MMHYVAHLAKLRDIVVDMAGVRNGIFALVLFLIPVTVAVAGITLLRFPPGYEAEAGLDEGETPTTTPIAEATTTSEVATSEVATVADEPEAETVEAVAGPVATTTYRVQVGDSLSEIGDRFGIDWRDIAQLNDITDPNRIFEGQVLRLSAPQATTLTIGTGEFDESLFAAAASGTTVDTELLKAVAWIASEWDASLIGPNGELGVGQLSPEIVQFINRDLLTDEADPSDPADSTRAMAAYLEWLLSQSGGELSPALAAYHEDLVTARNISWSNDTLVFVQRVVDARTQFVAAGS